MLFNPQIAWDLCVVLFIFNGATADDSKDSSRYLLARQLRESCPSSQRGFGREDAGSGVMLSSK